MYTYNAYACMYKYNAYACLYKYNAYACLYKIQCVCMHDTCTKYNAYACLYTLYIMLLASSRPYPVLINLETLKENGG